MAHAIRIAHLSLIDALYVAVAVQRPAQSERTLSSTDAIIAEYRPLEVWSSDCAAGLAARG